MKKSSVLFLIFSMSLLPASLAVGEERGNVEIKTFEDKVSYSIGVQIGTSLKRNDPDVDISLVQKGLEDAFKEQRPLMGSQDITTTLRAYQQQRQERMAKQMAAQGEININEGAKFLEENKSREGVKSTSSGLQYKVLKEGDGPKPTAANTVKVHYMGTLLDGTEFDSSYKRGEPAVFPLNGVIRGWTEGLQLMKVGSKYRLFIPSDLAYGAHGAGAAIGPNATLIFDVELLSIEE